MAPVGLWGEIPGLAGALFFNHFRCDEWRPHGQDGGHMFVAGGRKTSHHTLEGTL